MTANAGYHLYNTGDVLTAAQVQFNLQNQSVMYFATASARTTALSGVIVEGMVTYIPANGLEYYNGSAWVTLSTGGDITGVAAGKGLTGGGTTGDVTLSLGTTAKGDLVAGTGTTTAAALTVGANNTVLQADSAQTTGLKYSTPAAVVGNIVTAKGDLIAATASGTVSNLAVGTNNQVLTADSTAATGVKWATPATTASGLTLISTTSFSGATTANIDNIFSSTYTSYKIILSRWNTSGNTLLIKLRYGSSTQSTNYYGSAKGINSNGTDQTTLSSGATSFGAGYDNQTGSGVLEMLFTDVGTSAIQPMFSGIWNSQGNYLQLTGGQINTNWQTYTGIQFLSASGNVSGTVSVYGLAK